MRLLGMLLVLFFVFSYILTTVRCRPVVSSDKCYPILNEISNVHFGRRIYADDEANGLSFIELSMSNDCPLSSYEYVKGRNFHLLVLKMDMNMNNVVTLSTYINLEWRWKTVPDSAEWKGEESFAEVNGKTYYKYMTICHSESLYMTEKDIPVRHACENAIPPTERKNTGCLVCVRDKGTCAQNWFNPCDVSLTKALTVVDQTRLLTDWIIGGAAGKEFSGKYSLTATGKDHSLISNMRKLYRRAGNYEKLSIPEIFDADHMLMDDVSNEEDRDFNANSLTLQKKHPLIVLEQEQNPRADPQQSLLDVRSKLSVLSP